jgi:AAA family ATP:ADP antiporter
VDLGLALAVLPSVLAAGGIALLFGLGLGAALFTKGADGALRYSLHRTASELLYVPLPDRARPRIKAVLDLVGQRAGQAFASLAILLLTMLELPATVLPTLLLVLASLWAIFALGLRRDYVELLRGNLRGEATLRTITFPEFDVASLETLVSALDSHNDTEVLAALAVLERERKAHLVPALILHHPSDTVVEASLALFARARRDNVIHVIDRLFEHPSSRVRSSAIAARSLLLPDPRLLYLRLSLEDAQEVRATIIVHLIASGEIVGAEAEERLREILQRGRTPTKIALAEAIAWRQDADFDQVLVELSAAPDVEVRLAAIRAMTEHTSTSFLPSLLKALGDEQTRSAARHALVGYGTSGFEAVLAALRDVTQPQTLRWELPRALSLFEPEPAARALLTLLTSEPEGMVRYRIIRALETLVARHPTVNLDRAALERVMSDTIGRAYRYLNELVTLEAGARSRQERQTPGYELLMFVLHDKQENARDRLFRLLGLAYPSADFARIRRGLRSPSADTRESSVELVGTLLEQPMRGAVLGLIEDMTDAERLAWSGPYYTPVRRSYEEMLEHMLTRESQGVQDFTAYHVGELGLSQLRPLIAAIAEADPARADVARTLAALEGVGSGA